MSSSTTSGSSVPGRADDLSWGHASELALSADAAVASVGPVSLGGPEEPVRYVCVRLVQNEIADKDWVLLTPSEAVALGDLLHRHGRSAAERPAD